MSLRVRPEQLERDGVLTSLKSIMCVDTIGSPSLISLMVPVDVKHHVYLITRH